MYINVYTYVRIHIYVIVHKKPNLKSFVYESVRIKHTYKKLF